MPTRGRGRWATEAVDDYLSQTWQEKELVILDDANDPSFPDPASLPRGIRYFRSIPRWSIGQKRNELVRLASGDIVCHWDDDDWSAPERIATQVELMMSAARPVCGFYAMWFVEDTLQRAWKYTNTRRDYALGTSLLYTHEWWATHPFPDENVGEDYAYVQTARRENALVAEDACDLMVARIHPGNTSVRHTEAREYRSAEWNDLPRAFRARTHPISQSK